MILLRQGAVDTPEAYADAVALWQQFLISLGFDRPVVDGAPRQLIVDRDFGPTTAQATRDFQAANRLDADGTVGADTYRVANGLGFKSAPPSAPLAGANSVQAQKALLRAAFVEFGITDPVERAGIAAINLGESGMKPHTEGGYGGTSNNRIRTIFGTRVAGLSEEELNQLKADDEAFFNHVYGGAFGRANLGNTEAGDGYRYRGRGLNQLTGRGNYARYSTLLKDVDLIANPDLANDPAVAARVSVVYMKDRIPRGSSWPDMKRAVGNEVAATEAAKDKAFAAFQASGEFA